MPKRSKTMEEMLEYLRSQTIAVVGSVSAEGDPQVATVYFWVNDIKGKDFSIFFLTRRHTRKFANLLSNKKAAVVVGTAFEPNSVQIDGTAEIVDVGDNVKDMVELQKRLRKKPVMALLFGGAFYPKSPFRDLGKDFVLFRVRPTWCRWLRFDKAKKKFDYVQVLG